MKELAMDADKPCRCPRCGWLGTIHDAEAYQPLAHLEPLNICPRCCQPASRGAAAGPEGPRCALPGVRPAAQTGLPAPRATGAERRAQLERFFEHHRPTRRAPRQAPISSRAFKVIDERDKSVIALLKCPEVRHYQ